MPTDASGPGYNDLITVLSGHPKDRNDPRGQQADHRQFRTTTPWSSD
jgi:hypothetical protein